MTQLHTVMNTPRYVPCTVTDLATTVRNQALIPAPLWISDLPTKAPVVPGQGVHHHLAARTSPATSFCSNTSGPLLDTAKVKYLGEQNNKLHAVHNYTNLVTVVTVPCGVHLPHPVKADHALSQPSLKLLRKTITQIHIIICT